MDRLKARSFIKELIYDLDTVQYLLDYARLKETLPIINKVFTNIDTFRNSQSIELATDLFTDNFWANKLPGDLTLGQMRSNIHLLAHKSSPLIEEELLKIDYAHFIKNFFDWSEANISKLRRLTKSPLQQRIEKWLLITLAATLGLFLGINLSWLYLTRDWGLRGDFYQGKDFEQYLYSKINKTIDFSSPQEMNNKLPFANFSVLWQGNLLIPKDGQYTITALADDGVRVHLDKQLLFADWTGHPAKESSNKIHLTKGPHQIIIEYDQYTGNAVLKLYWSLDGGKKEIIPAQYLRH